MSNNHFTPTIPSGGGGSGINAVVQDTSPELGGNLDSLTRKITNTGAINFTAGTVDIITPGDELVRLKQSLGTVFNDPALGHSDLNNTFFFPTGQDLLYFDNRPLVGETLVVKMRDGASATIAIGANRICILGTTTAFQDRMIYDPLGCRAGKVVSSWTSVIVRPLLDNCMWKFSCHYDLDFAAPNANNRFKLYVQHIRGGGILRIYNILDKTTNGISNIGSATRIINGGGFSEDVLVNDEFKFVVECDASSPTQIAVCRLINWYVYCSKRV